MKSCFVLLPRMGNLSSTEDYEIIQEVYEDYIKPTVENLGLTCSCSSEILKQKHIINNIVNSILNSFIVMTELTWKDYNVFYEVGVRHALCKRTILISQNKHDIPLDLNYRTLNYRFTPSGAKKFKKDLKHIITGVLENPEENDSPILKKRQSNDENSQIINELNKVKVQNESLSQIIEDFKKVISSISLKITTDNLNLNGTWFDKAFNGYKYIHHNVVNGDVVIAYDGTWSGVIWGKIENNILPYKWSRFDKSLGGNGYFSISHQNELNGGLWFDETSLSDMLDKDDYIEKHILVRKSGNIEEPAQRLLIKAREFTSSKF